MTNITDMISQVYDILSSTLGSSGDASNYLQMGWPGIALGPADFKPYDNPQGNYDPQIAEETFSFLANIAPVCNALRFDNSGFEIDDLYQILLFSAIPLGADPNNLVANPMYKLFSDAQYEFVRAQRGSLRDPNVFYYPCRATPSDWYSEASAQFWPTISIASNQVKPANPSSAFIKFGGDQLVKKGPFVLKPQNVDSTKIEVQLKKSLALKTEAMQAKVKLYAKSGTVTKPALNRAAITLSSAKPLSVGRVASLSVNDHAFASRFAELNAVKTAKLGLSPAPVTSRLAQLPSLTIDPKKFDLLTVKGVTLDKQLLLRNLLTEQLINAPVTQTTDGFSISFKYCRVNIDRGSWFKAAMLAMKTWYMLNTRAGEYALGQYEANAGLFSMIPESFIAIRDLKITANWSQQDQANIKEAKYLGPFEIQSGSFNQNTIEAKGLQIIGWLSRLNPRLPPNPDPAIK